MDASIAVETEPGLFAPGLRAVSLAAIVLVSLLAFEAMAVATAMPAIAAALAGLDRYALAFGATLATSVIGMVAAGADCDRRGPGRATAAGLALFAAGLLLAAMAATMPMLIAGRVLQGLGSGALGVTLYVVVGRLYPPALRPRLFAMFSAAWVIPALVGPALAAMLVDLLGWPWVFLSALLALPPVAAAVLPAARRLGPPARAASDGSPPIAAAVVAALAALALHELASASGSAPPWSALAALVVLGVASARLLPQGTLRAARGLPSVIALRGLVAGAFFAAEAFLPLWLNLEQGWSHQAAGFALTAGAVCWSIGSQGQGRVRDPRARQRVLGGGLALLTLALSLLALSAAMGWPAWAVLAWALAGLGVGLAFPSLSVLLLTLSSEHEQGRHSSALQLADALATTAALALVGALFVALRDPAPVAAFVAVFGGAAALAMLARVLSARTLPPAVSIPT